MTRSPASLAATLGALLALSICTPAVAQPLVRMDVVDRDTGQWLPGHRHRLEDWIAGTPGHRYAVRLTNTTGERVLVVLSIDGVNAVTGETAHPSQAGYVLEPWQSAEIAGWRKSYQDIAQFVFTSLPDSYAARTGRPDNVGTIGIAVFRERRQDPTPSPPPPPIARAESAAKAAEARTADAYGPAAQRQRIGTGHGEREWSPTGNTRFVRASSRPAQITQLRYDAPEALVAMGILPHPYVDRVRPGRPQAFPGGFVADPPDRRWRR
jgi:hypothetical protein